MKRVFACRPELAFALMLLLTGRASAAEPGAATPAAAASPAADDAAAAERRLSAAREAFREGVTLARESRLDAAVAAFERSLELVPHAATHYNLALTELARARLSAARGQLLAALARGKQDALELPAEVASAVCARLVEVTERLVWIDVTLPRAGAKLAIDGKLPSEEMEGGQVTLSLAMTSGAGARFVATGTVRLLLEPGSHEVWVDFAGARHAILVNEPERTRRTVSFADVAETKPALPLPTAPALRTPPLAPKSDGSRHRLQIPAFAIAGVAAVSSAVFGVLALDAKSELDAICPDHSSCPAGSLGQRQVVSRYALLSDVCLAAALAGAGVGIYATLSAPSAAGSHTAQIGLRGSF
jgi:hypothetical protein